MSALICGISRFAVSRGGRSRALGSFMACSCCSARTRNLAWNASISARSSSEILSAIGTSPRVSSGRRLLGRRGLRPQAEEVADGVDQVGAVHGVEVELGHAAVDEVEHLL